MGHGSYWEPLGRTAAQEQLRRRAIIEVFFRACSAARRTTGVGSHSSNQPPTGASTLRPAPACFTLLGLTWPCTGQEVKQAFRLQAKMAHPDTGGSNEAFQALHKAYKEALALV